MRIGIYAAIERIDFIREGKKFTLEQYMRKFEISRSTAFRDFDFIRSYRREPLHLECTNGVYQFSSAKEVSRNDFRLSACIHGQAGREDTGKYDKKRGYKMTFEEEMKQNIVELVEKKTVLEKRIFELEKENEKLMQMLASSADCETCKHYDEDLEKEDKEPCKNCFYDNSFWELKED